jgi:hypothetical protein
LPNSNVDLSYNPKKPTQEDLEYWDNKFKAELVKEGRELTASYYAQFLPLKPICRVYLEG